MSKKSNDIIKSKIYPLVEKAISNSTIQKKYTDLIGRFIVNNHNILYDNAPYDIIYYRESDIDELFNTLKLNREEIYNILKTTYYFDMTNFNPEAAKAEYVIVLICILRYFLLVKKDQKKFEMTSLYLTFSGKFYASAHTRWFPKFRPSQNRYIMEYIVNSDMIDKQYKLKKFGTLVDAFNDMTIGCLTGYTDRLKEFEDDDISYVIQQVKDRLIMIIYNIAKVYYKVYESKDKYFVYNADNVSDTSMILAVNDSHKIEQATQKTMNKLTTQSVDLKLISMLEDVNVSKAEIKSIIETMLNDNRNVNILREYISITLSNYFKFSKSKEIVSVEFLSYALSAKPNTADKLELRRREIIETILNNESTNYVRRKNRPATKISYNKALYSYIVFTIYNANK